MASEAESGDLSGTTLARYRLLEKLGAGGMGVVYRARDTALHRDVALKLLPADLAADERARATLLREARTASRLNHPNICTVHEVGEAGGRVYIAMELVEGRPLKALIPPDGLADETVLRYGAQIARALAHAHARQVVHRDLKSANVVVGPGGEAKLLDFGLSRRVLEEARGGGDATSTGVVAGTPQYLAPELLMGGRAGPASDLWALGVVLYEMCAGRPPFAGEPVGVLVTAVLRAMPEPLPARVAPGLRAVVMKCLAKEPAQRFGSADEVAAALEALLPGSGPGPRAARRHRAVPTRGLAGAALALALVAVLLATDTWHWRTRLFRGRPAGTVRSLAVLPLENRPPDPAQEYFADGMTEQLISDLAQVRGLSVISRTSVMRFKGTRQPVAEIAAALGVDAVVEGSVQREGGKVRVQAHLVDGATERQLWAGSFDRPLQDALALQSDVAQEITSQIRARLTGEERSRLRNPPEVDPAAFDHYLKGRFALANERAAEAIAEFRQALARDSGYARAWAGLAHSLVRAQDLGDSTAEAVRGPALRAGTRAVELEGTSTEAWLALADVQATLGWDLTAAQTSARRALELGPGDAEAHHTYGLVAGAMGRVPECVAEMRRATELDPLNAYYQQQLGVVLIFARRPAEAVTELANTLQLFPDYTQARVGLGWARLESGDAAGAIRELKRVTPPGAQLGRAYAKAGRAGDARRVLSGLEARWKRGEAKAADVALVYAALGDKDQAFAWLERARAGHERGFLELPFHPGFDALRSDPRYAALAAGLPAPIPTTPPGR